MDPRSAKACVGSREPQDDRVRGLLWVMLGGGLGSGLRYGVGLLALRWVGGAFPWGTLLVNLVGSALLAFFLSETSRAWSLELKLFLTTGLMGGFTTYSSFNFEVLRLWQQQPLWAVAYVVATLFGALAVSLWMLR